LEKNLRRQLDEVRNELGTRPDESKKVPEVKPEKTSYDMLLGLDSLSSPYKEYLPPEGWALWKIVAVYRPMLADIIDVLDVDSYLCATPSIEQLCADPDFLAALETVDRLGFPMIYFRAALEQARHPHKTKGWRERLEKLVFYDTDLGESEQDIDRILALRKAFDLANKTIKKMAEWIADFLYPAPSAEELYHRRELQRLALATPPLNLTPQEQKVIPAWIDSWWSVQATAKQLGEGFSRQTVGRVMDGFLSWVDRLFVERRRKKEPVSALKAFVARTVPIRSDECDEGWYEIQFALIASPKDGERWGQAFGGASIRNIFHHGIPTFDRWGQTISTRGSSHEEHRGQFWDDYGEESAA